MPSVSLSYNTQNLQQSFSYAIHTERPPVGEMNDNAVYTDRFTYRKGGNPKSRFHDYLSLPHGKEDEESECSRDGNVAVEYGQSIKIAE